MQRIPNFIWFLYQIVIKQLDLFSTIQITVDFGQLSWTTTFYASPNRFRRVIWVILLSWRPLGIFLQIRMQLYPTFSVRDGEELPWCPSWSSSMWQGWSCGLVYCPAGNATDPIWRVLASSQGISTWTPLKHQHSNPNSNTLTNQLWCIDFLIPLTPLIILHRLPAFLESLMLLKNWCLIHARWLKSSLKQSIRFCGLFSKFKTEFYSVSFF